MKRFIYFLVFTIDFTTILFFSSIIYFFSTEQKIDIQELNKTKIKTHKIILCGFYDINNAVYHTKHNETFVYIPIYDKNQQLKSIVIFNVIFQKHFPIKSKYYCHQVLKPTFWRSISLPKKVIKELKIKNKNIPIFIYQDYKTLAIAMLLINLIVFALVVYYFLKYRQE